MIQSAKSNQRGKLAFPAPSVPIQSRPKGSKTPILASPRPPELVRCCHTTHDVAQHYGRRYRQKCVTRVRPDTSKHVAKSVLRLGVSAVQKRHLKHYLYSETGRRVLGRDRAHGRNITVDASESRDIARPNANVRIPVIRDRPSCQRKTVRKRYV